MVPHSCPFFLFGPSQGCDASILIDSTEENEAEKDADQNGSVRGYDLIEEAKERVEEACPGKVSCADIITIATRDAVALSGGTQYKVPTGRRDGLVSKKTEVDLPGGSISVGDALKLFGRKGIRREEMVSLMGGHTVGVAGGAPLDPQTPFTVDNEFYKGILNNRGVLPIDRELAVDASTRGIVTRFAANNATFETSFADAMIKMGRIQVLLGKAGEIRNKCNAFNN